MGVYEIGWRIGERHLCRLICYEDAVLEDGVFLSILRCRRRGSGTPCMERFIDVMARMGYSGIRLEAYPMDYPPGQAPREAVQRLVRWYERFGFRLRRNFREDSYNEMVLAL
ncbi:MAG: hypothetical protein QMD46_01225 [Methanomicrobiales archaeon]|nr:hypothetical protein [Methanomicrobiales archaeon]MDI6875717.1 hypothetical protein [Methanomicrobiales archaeon]